MKVCVFTAIFGNHDTLKKMPKQSIPCSFFCITDQKTLPIEKGAEKQRTIIYKESKPEYCDRMNAKRYRTHVFDYIKADVYVYMDGTGRLLNTKSIEYFVTSFLPKSDILTYQHCERDCIYDEAMFSQYASKYKGLPLREQVSSYRKEGMPEHWGLSATGLLIFRPTERAKKFLHRRREENVKWTYQDQLSFDYCVRKLGIRRQRISDKYGTLWSNKLISFIEPHIRNR